MSNIILVDQYYEILLELGKWKVISLKNLFSNLKIDETYQMFCFRVRRLEKEGLINSVLGSNKRKYLSLTNEGMKFSPTAFESSDPATFNHDLISSTVASTLLRKDIFEFVERRLSDECLDLEPDGYLKGKKLEQVYLMALEIELTQKSKKRVTEKFNKYSECNDFDYCLYLTNKRSLYNSYCKILDSLEEKVREKIIIAIDEKLSPTCFRYKDTNCYFQGKELHLNNLLG